METFPQTIEIPATGQKRRRVKRSVLLFFSVPLCLCGSGCVIFPKAEKDDPMPHGEVCQAVATWNHQVVFAADPVHGGAEEPGLVGRLYLFGPEVSFPLIDDGSVVIDLFDDTQPSAQTGEKGRGEGAAQPLPLEEWRFDPVTLKKLVKKDMVGWGYTLFLPWGTYKPDINQVHLKVRYVTAKGIPFFAESGPLSLQQSPIVSSSHRVVPGAATASLPTAPQTRMATAPPNGPPIPVR